MTITAMNDVDLKGKRVLIREDLNVPMKGGEITSDTRIREAVPTIQQALKAGAAVMVLSHLGRPEEGIYDEKFAMGPVAKKLEELLDHPVRFEKHWLENGVEITPGEVVMCGNPRFHLGEKACDPALAQRMAKLCDVFIMDAFATAHRNESSTTGLIRFAPIACMGPLLLRELNALEKVLHDPAKPVVAIVGGSKVSTKLQVLDALVTKVDTLIVGGGIANTFMAAEGDSVGDSLYEPDLVDEAERIQNTAAKHGAQLPIPTDVIVGDKLSEDAESFDLPVSQVDSDNKIFDIGPETIKAYEKIISKAGTILWNGPVGAFEISHYAEGTKAIAKAIAASNAFSVAGGGDTLAAIDAYKVADGISYISTGGGAFLTLLEGKKLPVVEALENKRVEAKV